MSTRPALRPESRRAPARRLLRLLLSFTAAFTAACGDKSLRPHPLPDQADLYWSLRLNHHAVALGTASPYDTLQLVATPLNFHDDTLADLPAAQYQSGDAERVIVTANGVLVAVAATSQPVPVVATLTANNLKHVDTVLVSVFETAAPPVLDSFSIHPIPPDSAKIGSMVSPGGTDLSDTLPMRAATSEGEPIPVYGRDVDGYLPVYVRSLDTAVAKVNSAGIVRGIKVGSANIYASTTAFGISKVDTLPYRVGAPIVLLDFVVPIGDLNKLDNRTPTPTIGTGGAVVWIYSAADSADTLDVTFDDADVAGVAALQPAADHLGLSFFCGDPNLCLDSGNLLITSSTPFVPRYFPTPGTYNWRSLRKGVTGSVVVVDER